MSKTTKKEAKAEIIKASNVFLNIFGFTLDSNDITYKKNINLLSIYNREFIPVGHLNLYNDTALINLKFQDINLKAEARFAPAYGHLYTHIIFTLNIADIKISGSFLTHGLTFDAKQVYEYYETFEIINKNNILALSINKRKFYYNKISLEGWENIRIKANGFERYIIHDLQKNNNYRKYVSVATNTSRKEHHVYLEEKQEANNIIHVLDFKNEYRNFKLQNRLIEQANIMQEIDPDTFIRIKELKEILTINDLNIFSNLINLVYNDLNAQELEALFGLKNSKTQSETKRILKK